MMLQAIKEAIEHLPKEDRRKLAAWFEELGNAAWDGQIARDFAPGGRGERLAKEIRQEIAEGKSRPLAEGLAKRHKTRA